MFRKHLIAYGAFLAAFGANAQTSVDLDLTGTITPASCTLNITGNSVLDIGTYSVADVMNWSPWTETDGTPLRIRTPNMLTTASVVCDAPALFGIAFSDPNAAKMLSVDENYYAVVNSANNDAPIGYTRVFARVTSLNGGSAERRLTTAGVSGAPSWSASNGTSIKAMPGNTITWAANADAIAPEPISSLNFDIAVTPMVRLNDVIAQAGGGITLAARTTMTLRMF